ncbi:MAG: 4-hydroxy-3-methylbut-2-enyl diphosphate reductase [Pseudomonadota bacterium]
MKISIAKTAGFCMGVRRAVDVALDAANKDQGPIYTYGPLIHNPQVLDLLKEKGVTVLDAIPEKGTGTVIVRAHGVPPEAKEALKTAGFTVVDATCPRVIKVQTIIARHAKLGGATIIVGDPEHPEVIGLQGYAEGKGFVAGTLAELAALPPFENAIIVAQTTQSMTVFDSVKAWAGRRHPHYKVFDTICDSTQKRQDEISHLSKTVDAVVVVGGRNSGNTRRLAELAREAGVPAYHVETEAELDGEALSSIKSIAITAGASTPNWVTKKVFRYLEALPKPGGPGLWNRICMLQRTLLLTTIYVAAGAGCLCYACNRMQGIEKQFPYVLIALLYVLSMHLLNNLTGRKIDRYKDPDRALFYNTHKTFLTLLAISAGAAGLLTAATVGWAPFLMLSAMSVTGLLYNTQLAPRGLMNKKYRGLRDIPGSKTILITIAWGVVTAIFPSLAETGRVSLQALLIFLWAAGMVFVRTAFFDILDIQGDRIVGKETIPVLLGENRTRLLLKATLIFLFIMLQVSAALQIVSSLGFALAVCPVFLFIVLTKHEGGKMLPGIRLEFLVESHFVLAGAITLILA